MPHHPARQLGRKRAFPCFLPPSRSFPQIRQSRPNTRDDFEALTGVLQIWDFHRSCTLPTLKNHRIFEGPVPCTNTRTSPFCKTPALTKRSLKRFDLFSPLEEVNRQGRFERASFSSPSPFLPTGRNVARPGRPNSFFCWISTSDLLGNGLGRACCGGRRQIGFRRADGHQVAQCP